MIKVDSQRTAMFMTKQHLQSTEFLVIPSLLFRSLEHVRSHSEPCNSSSLYRAEHGKKWIFGIKESCSD